MSFKFLCPHCQQKLEADEELIGQTLECPNCGNTIIVEDKKENNHIISDIPQKSSKSKTSFPNLSELRNQRTMVSGLPVTETLHVPNQKTNSQFSKEYLTSTITQSFNLPFEVNGFVAQKILAQGGMSVTYLGNSIEDETKQVVVKIPRLDSERTVEMFRNECHILEQFKHPGIVPILSYGDTVIQDVSCPFMVMKFVSGQSLRQQLKNKGKLSWEEAAHVLDDIANALKYLHENNFCHRDIKPDNIIYDQELNQWVLVDFGIAKSMQDNIMMTMTLVGQDSGTWDYMPPEQLEGRAVDIRCDIYALGTVIWESLIGTVPRRGTKLPSQYEDIEVPEDVDILISKMVEHKIEDRYQTPDEVLSALHKGAKKVEQWKKVHVTIRRFSGFAIVLAFIFFLLTVIWFCGNWIYAAKAHAIFEKHKSSATIALRELNIYKKRCPLYWGHSHIIELIKVNKLESKAEKEQEEMHKEYSMSNDVFDIKGNLDELETRKIKAQNFISKWKDKFEETKEYKEIQLALDNLSSTIQIMVDDKLVEDTILSIKPKLEESNINYRQLLSTCHNVEKKIITENAKSKLSKYIITIRTKAVGDRLSKIEPLITSNSFHELSIAYNELSEMEDIIGPDDIISSKMEVIDDKFWKLCENASLMSLEKKKYAQARSDVRTYIESGFKRHTGEAQKQLSEIDSQQQRTEWEETLVDYKKYMEDKNFKVALRTIENFEKKYSDTSIDIDSYKEKISNSFLSYARDKAKNLEDFLELFDQFVDIFPKDSNSISILRRELVFSVHNESRNILINDELEWSVKRDRLGKIKYSRCDSSQREYLDKLISTAQNYAANPSKSNQYAYLYYFQRPPRDCVSMSKEPTIYFVTINSIYVSLSSSHYNELRGMNHCNPEILIGKRGEEPWWTLAGPEDQYSFSLTKELKFWWDIEDIDLLLQIGDADHSPFDAATYTGTLRASSLKYSNSTNWKWDNGTTLEIKWITK